MSRTGLIALALVAGLCVAATLAGLHPAPDTGDVDIASVLATSSDVKAAELRVEQRVDNLTEQVEVDLGAAAASVLLLQQQVAALRSDLDATKAALAVAEKATKAQALRPRKRSAPAPPPALSDFKLMP